MKQKILTITAIAGVGVMVVAAVLPALFPAQEVYAPSSRRGFMCEFRPAVMSEPWMPYTQAVIESVEAQSKAVI